MGLPEFKATLQVKPAQFANVIRIKSRLDDIDLSILATVVEFPYKGKSQKLVVTKSSMLGDIKSAQIDGKELELTLVGRDEKNDLAILSAKSNLKGILLSKSLSPQHFNPEKENKLLASILEKGNYEVSVLSAPLQEIPEAEGYFGAGARFIDNKVTITNIIKGGSSEGILKSGDKMVSINDVPIEKPIDYNTQVDRYSAGQRLKIVVIRGDSTKKIDMVLREYMGENMVPNRFKGGRSIRKDGFPNVFVHDGKILAEDCGGPVYTAKGEFVGINIARYCRTATLIVPDSEIIKVLEKCLEASSEIKQVK